ncbi:pilus assembly PilX N-terminal domain-containing protein [Candidatus Kaiserbacteria bacterium]|nr:pilus assembly PilX N-terminal domain-containing protein [Candidatus Kaiserbacteria bacterium]MCB9812164.1 pilus assembly PilX N-terminal domain-containing protein [Candidatus Nomurabacteria bacterium]
MNRHTNSQPESGFALLMALIVVGVVLTIGLSILDLSIKQVRLSSNADQSEVAYHAANAGMECARFIRRSESDAMEDGEDISDINPSCFGVGTYAEDFTDHTGESYVPPVNEVELYQYEYSFSWGSSCTLINTLVASSSPLVVGTLEVTDMDTLVRGYPNLVWDFQPGEKPTVISVRGFNKSCNNIDSYGTIQRELLIEF